MKNNDLLAWMQSRGMGVAPTQAPAFGGIANPSQRAKLRGSDQAYLEARQKELDAYETQRAAYNTGLTKYQDEVYKPYQAQAEAYNAAAQKYNTDVYDPYKTQYEAYEKAITDYNAGPRTTDYAGPAEPTLASKFEMTAPTTPDAFSLTSPTLPFKEEDVVAYQKEAAQTAQSDAENRGLAIDVVSDPSKYNFGSMSVTNRFMAEGGPVDAAPSGQARNMMNQMTGLVASAGRGGDTKLAHLSSQSAALLKSQGGAGTINPKTGLPEYLVMIMPAEQYDEAAKTNFRGMPLAGYQRGGYSPGYLEGLAAAEEAKKKAAADAAAAALAESQRRDAQNAAAEKAIAERLAKEKADAEAARLETEKEAARIYASRVRDQRVAGPVAGTVASTVRPAAADYSFNTRAATPLGPVDLGNRYIRPPVTPIGSRTPTYTSPRPSQPPREERPAAPTTLPTFIDNNLTRIPTAAEIALPDIDGQKRAITNPKNFFALDPSRPPSIPGLTPGTVALAPLDLPLAAGKKTLEAIAANPNLSPQMLGGKENAGIMIDRLGNRIYSPGAKPLLYRSGGEVSKDLNALLAQNAETLSDEQPEDTINTNPVGTAQAFLADLGGAGKASPTRQSVKRVKTSAGGGATADKAMQLAYEDIAKGDLGAMKDRAPAVKNTESARSQMEELARVYQLKIRAAQNAAKGLSADTFGAPTLEQPTLTKGKLTKKRFKDGGEAKKPDAFFRAEGSPEEGEESLDKYYAPKARTSTGMNRKKGPISQQLDSGEAYVNMAKGVTELPYDLLGSARDVSNMIMTPFGYGVEKPVMGSDFIKEKMTKLGIRPEPPADPTAKGFYTAGQLLSNLTNPAGVTRSAVKGAQKTGEAATAVAKDFQEYNRQLSVPGASYAVRPTGSTVLSGPVGMKEDVSRVDQLLKNGLSNAKSAAGQNEGQAMILQDFWDKKARNYFTRQFGTPDDPVARAIANKQIKGPALEEDFPGYLIDQIGVGKTRVKEGARPKDFVGPGAPESRFFPKYPKALEDFTASYDKATGLKGNLVTLDPKAANPKYEYLLSDEGKLEGLTAQYKEQDKLITQGLRPELINTNVGTVTRSGTNKNLVIGEGTESAKALLDAYEESKQFGKMNDKQKTSFVNKIFGEGRKILGKNEEEVGKNLLPQNVQMAIDKSELVYDIDNMRSPLTNLFDARSINQYLASIPPREAANIRFEDAVKGALKLKEKIAEMENVVARIKAGKPVADTVFSRGVSGPLLQISEGPLEGFAWKRIEKREATLPEGAYVGHSVGGYETGGVGYTREKMEGFDKGLWQVYTLRDNRNRPVNTIEVKMLDERTPVVMQIKGNGAKTGNVPADKYDFAVVDFLKNYLKPAAIQEEDKFLTPLLQKYKTQLGPSPSTR